MWTLDDLVRAYRKAKVDLFYSNDSRPLELVEYEENLNANLRRLLACLNSESTTWATDANFVGTWTIMPKSLPAPKYSDGGELVHAGADDLWAEAVRSAKPGKPHATFRVASMCSLDMHVMSALWIGTVGQKLDHSLSDDVRGQRVRRQKNGRYNWAAPGSYYHYFGAYRAWRDDGLKAASEELKAKRSVVVLTADVTAFYHRLDPSFITDHDFLHSVAQVNLTADEHRLNGQLVDALLTWRANVATELGVDFEGLPVGLQASAVIANLSLLEFDAAIQKLHPIYYGRYVDDVILVMRAARGRPSARAVWKRISDSADGLLHIDETGPDEKRGVEFRPSYLRDSLVRFDSTKNKVFHLKGNPGRALLASLQRKINERASEWRELPSLPRDPQEIPTLIVSAVMADGDQADALRKTESLSASRAEFAMQLRDFEAYARDLDPAAWKQHRAEFFKIVAEQVIALPTFFDLAQYLPRIFQLAIVCRDWDNLNRILRRLARVYQQLDSKCEIHIQAVNGGNLNRAGVLATWATRLQRHLEESLAVSARTELPPVARRRMLDILVPIPGGERLTESSFLPSASTYLRLFSRDLASESFRSCLLPEEFAEPYSGVSPEALTPQVDDELVPRLIRSSLAALAPDIARGAPLPLRDRGPLLVQAASLVFPTRPLGPAEMFAVTRVLSDREPPALRRVSAWLLATRGYISEWPGSLVPGRPLVFPREDDARDPVENVGLALAMLKTEIPHLDAARSGHPDRGLARYQALNDLVNRVIKDSGKHVGPAETKGSGRVRYMVFPELSIPTRWFMRLASKLASSDISLIAGVEYVQGAAGEIRNQTWSSFVHHGIWRRTHSVYRQDKQVPAPMENSHLAAHSLKLVPDRRWATPPLIMHGNVRLAILVCSELTNISHRSALRGQIELLVVPEWNQDLNTFGALVESAALDVHAAVAQVNNRSYGDTRIRAPYTIGHMRDVVQVRGGALDYYVIGDVPVGALRRAHTGAIQHDAKGEPLFKPLPDGFPVSNGVVEN